MELFLRIDVNLIAILLLTVVLFVARNRLDVHDELNRLFLYVAFVVLCGLSFETLTCVINAVPIDDRTLISSILHVCLFSAAPFLTYSWYLFIRRWSHPRGIVLRTRWFLLLPVLFNACITVLSPFFGLVFRFDETGHYQRGDWFAVSMVVTYVYVLLAVVQVIRRRDKIVREEYVPVLFAGILPLLGALFQCLFYGILLMWSLAAFSLVILCIFLQQRMVYIDKLTGVWCRASFEYYLNQRIRQKSSDRFGLIFFDLDGLKFINDRYGHMAGDIALATTASILKSGLRKNDILARFGGDEFVALLDDVSEAELNAIVDGINDAFSVYNNSAKTECRLTCSSGWDLYEPAYQTVEEFLSHVDLLMYYNKKEKTNSPAQ